MKKILVTLLHFMFISFLAQSQGGSLDLGFGTNGFVLSPAVSMNYNGIARQPDGKLIVVGDRSNGGLSDFAILRYLATGSLDPNFDQDGLVITNFGNEFDMANSVAIQPDGKIVVAGVTGPYSGITHLAISRYYPNGGLDISFGNNGLLIIPNNGGTLGVHDIAIQPDGKIVVVGERVINGWFDFSIHRINSDGAMDIGFGQAGMVLIDFGGFNDISSAVEIQEDGKILVAGSAANDLAVARLNSDGNPDESFGGDGKVTTNLTGYFGPRDASMTLQTDGKIIVAVSPISLVNFLRDGAIIRYNQDGSLDASFSDDGLTVYGMSGVDETINDLACQADGKIVVGGSTRINGTSDFAIRRFTPGGILDAGFGNGGDVITHFGSNEAIKALVLTNDKIYAAGITTVNGGILAAYHNANDCALGPLLEVNVSDVYAVSPGGNANTIYIGYGPSSLTLTANITGGHPSYNFSWKLGATLLSSGQTLLINPSSDGTYDYIVTVTDAWGCIKEFTKTIYVIDLRSGHDGDKILLCHGGRERSVLPESVVDHLTHGDYLGNCPPPPPVEVGRAGKQTNANEIAKGFKIYPNPATNFLDVQWTTTNKSQTTIRILNAEGRVVKTLTTKGAINNQRISLEGLAKGIYMLVLKTGSDQKVSKFVIQ